MGWLDGRSDSAQLGEMTRRVHALETAQKALLNAFDKFFDAVAEDLGYTATAGYNWNFPYTVYKVSPRSLAETITPEKRVIKRNPTARCAKPKKETR